MPLEHQDEGIKWIVEKGEKCNWLFTYFFKYESSICKSLPDIFDLTSHSPAS